MSDFDLIIRGGTIIDGTMLPRYRADIGIQGGRITRIGKLKATQSARTIDAEGCIVAPGYVDIHTHYDAQILWDPYCSISGWHGATSVVLGNCGFGFAPVRPEARDRSMLMMTRNEAIPFETMKEGMEWEKYGWVTLPDWFDHLDRIPKGVNCTSFVPLNPLYAWVMGGVDEAKKRRPTKAEMAQMIHLINEAMDRGACGFSYQRCGLPSVQPDWDGSPMITDLLLDGELLEFGRALKERGEGFIGMFDVAPTDHPTVEAFLTKLAEESGRPISRTAVVGNDEHPESHQAFMNWLEEGHERGLQLYGLGSTVRGPMFFTFEDWSLWDGAAGWHDVMNGPFAERAAKMRKEEVRKELRREVDAGLVPAAGVAGPPADLVVHSTGGYATLDRYVGRCVSDIAREQGKHPVDIILDVALASDFKAEFVGETIGCSAATMASFINSPYVVPGLSDGGAHMHFITMGAYPTDLLEWMVRDEGLVTAEKAHYGLSRLPAHIAGFHDRGVLRVGGPADVVVYDPATIRRAPSWNQSVKLYDQPAGGWRRAQRAEGLHYTICNGAITFEGLKCTGATPGQFVRQ